MTHPEPGPRRLIHLPKHEHCFIQHTGLLELRVKLFALPGSLAYPTEDAGAFILTSHVVDHLHDEDGLADAGTAERPAFPPLSKGVRMSIAFIPVVKISLLVECSLRLTGIW
jgi:hypothetical protein